MSNLFLFLLGIALYYWLIKPLIRRLAYGLGGTPANNESFMRVLFIVAREVAQVDGDIKPEEMHVVVQLIRKLTGSPDMDERHIHELFQAYGSATLTPEDVASLSMRYRSMIFVMAYKVAESDHTISRAEKWKLMQIGKQLELPVSFVNMVIGGQWQDGQQGQQGPNARSGQWARAGYRDASEFAHEVLGLERGASQAEIKKAYRKLAMKHHPDRASQDNKAEAEERFKEIGEAYKILMGRN